MPALDASLQEKLGRLDERGQRRILRVTERDGVVARRGEADLLSFSCNDYLGLTRHPEVIKAAQDALQLYGAGAGASRLITGNNPLYNELENLLAETKGTEAACVFGSGYLANLGVIPALVGRGDLILADKLSHACMLDGAKLSGAKLLRFSHNDAEHCQQLLATHRGNYNKCLLMTETIFSMDGDPAPLAELSSLAEKFDSSLLTDDAHGLGFNPSTRRGEHGRGTLLAKPDQANPHPNPTLEREGNWVQMGTLSKASGSYGGYVCGSATLIDYIKTSARSLIYSTALPPATLAASISALRIMQQEPERCAKPLRHAQYFTELLGLPLAQSAIVPVLVGDSVKAMQLSQELEDAGFLVAAIRPPTVPENTARLRVAFSALHTKEQIDALAAQLKKRGMPCAS